MILLSVFELLSSLIYIQTATVRSSSPFREEPSSSDIDRQRLQPDQARSHFEPARVDARDVDFSDSIASKRKSYRTTRGSRHRREDGTEVLGDISEDEDESLERKLARLRREAEELKEQLANKVQKEVQSGETTTEGLDDGILELSRTLDNLHATSRGTPSFSAEAELTRKLSTSIQYPDQAQKTDHQTPASDAPAALLSNAASFEARLTLLEAALGLAQTPVSLSADDTSATGLQPILPTLNNLSSQLSTLTNTLTHAPSTTTSSSTPSTLTTPHLESLTTRIRKLTADADSLASARRRATEAARAVLAARIAAATSEDPIDIPAASVASPTETDAAASDQAAKIQALYTTLPTITSLHPLLPSVLERLRSLRAIHAGAARASEDLDALERGQADMKRDIEQWRDGLKVMEERVRESEATMKGNVEVMGPWVRDLERRLTELEK